jgi:flagellar biosynthesis component FlhA
VLPYLRSIHQHPKQSAQQLQNDNRREKECVNASSDSTYLSLVNGMNAIRFRTRSQVFLLCPNNKKKKEEKRRKKKTMRRQQQVEKEKKKEERKKKNEMRTIAHNLE